MRRRRRLCFNSRLNINTTYYWWDLLDPALTCLCAPSSRLCTRIWMLYMDNAMSESMRSRGQFVLVLWLTEEWRAVYGE